MGQYWIDKIFLVAIAIFSAAGLWNVLKEVIHRNKTKAETDNLIAQTYKELVLEIRRELNVIRADYTSLHKEFSQTKMKHHLELEEERKSCHGKIEILNKRIWQLENRN